MSLLEGLIFSSSNVKEYDDFFKYCEEYFKEIYENNHKITAETLDVLYEMGDVYNCLNRKEESFNAYVKCFNARSKLLGENHPDTLKALNEVIKKCMDQDKKLDYIRLNEEILKKYNDEEHLKALYLLLKVENGDKFLQLHNQISSQLQKRSSRERVEGYLELASTLMCSEITPNADFFKLMINDIDSYFRAFHESFVDDILNDQTPKMSDQFIEVFYKLIVLMLQLGFDVYDMLIKTKTLLLNLERCHSSIKKDEAGTTSRKSTSQTEISLLIQLLFT